MGTVVVGFVPKPEGEAALDRAIEEAKLREARVVVVNSHRGGADLDQEASARADREMDSVKARLADAGLDHEVRKLVRGFEPAEDLLGIADDVDAELIVIGLP